MPNALNNFRESALLWRRAAVCGAITSEQRIYTRIAKVTKTRNKPPKLNAESAEDAEYSGPIRNPVRDQRTPPNPTPETISRRAHPKFRVPIQRNYQWLLFCGFAISPIF
jgi:hypothetical protein